jgi:hypothetical protein
MKFITLMVPVLAALVSAGKVDECAVCLPRVHILDEFTDKLHAGQLYQQSDFLDRMQCER